MLIKSGYRAGTNAANIKIDEMLGKDEIEEDPAILSPNDKIIYKNHFQDKTIDHTWCNSHCISFELNAIVLMSSKEL